MTAQSRFETALHLALSYAEEHQFAGYDKFDALNSPLLQTLSFKQKLLRLIFIQGVMRAPLNLRPLFGVPRQKNPKGIALFAQTYCLLYRLWGQTAHQENAIKCLDWLKARPAPGNYAGLCWGYNFPWQSTGFYAPRYSPNLVVSSFVGQALLDGYEVLQREDDLTAARSIVEFMHHDLNRLQDDTGRPCYSYTPFDHWRVINVTALAAGFLARLYHHCQEQDLIDEATQLMAFVVSKQTDYGAWFYTDPPNLSHLTHDNYHTGFVLDALLTYLEVSGNQQWWTNYKSGLDFYETSLFLANGAPKFQYNQIYPLDVHGAAQGIISFARAARYQPGASEIATRITTWALDHLFGNDGHFYYQKRRFFTRRIAFMRWNQAWMCLALSSLIQMQASQKNDAPTT